MMSPTCFFGLTLISSVLVLWTSVLISSCDARQFHNTPPYPVGCFEESGLRVINNLAAYPIFGEYSTCCSYIDGEQLYACDKKTRYYAGSARKHMFTVVDSNIIFADMPYATVEYLNIIHGFVGQLRDAMFHITRGLNEMHACTASGGANCTAQLDTPFRLFTEEACLEDYDDDGDPLNDKDDYHDIRCPTSSTPVTFRGLFSTIIPDYAALTGQIAGVDFDPIPMHTGYTPDAQLNYYIYQLARTGRGRFFKRKGLIAPAFRESIEFILNVAQLSVESNATALRNFFAFIREKTAPWSYEYRRPLIHTLFESHKTQFRFEDLVRFGRAVVSNITHPGLDRTVSCLERFYFGDADPIGSYEIARLNSMLSSLDRLTMLVDDDDETHTVDHPGMFTPHCSFGRKINPRARAYLNYTFDVDNKRVCHPFEDDPFCEQRGGSNHRASDVSQCIRNAYDSIQPIAEQITMSLQFMIQSLHTRIAKIQELLRIGRDYNLSTFRFPNNTECFDVPSFRASLYN